jgi:hypothetical protein
MGLLFLPANKLFYILQNGKMPYQYCNYIFEDLHQLTLSGLY